MSHVDIELGRRWLESTLKIRLVGFRSHDERTGHQLPGPASAPRNNHFEKMTTFFNSWGL